MKYLFVLFKIGLQCQSKLQLELVVIVTAHKWHLEQCQNVLFQNLFTKRSDYTSLLNNEEYFTLTN